MSECYVIVIDDDALILVDGKNETSLHVSRHDIVQAISLFGEFVDPAVNAAQLSFLDIALRLARLDPDAKTAIEPVFAQAKATNGTPGQFNLAIPVSAELLDFVTRRTRAQPPSPDNS